MSTFFLNETPEEARARRSKWPVQKGTFKELETDETDASEYLTIEERFAAMWQMAQSGCAMQGIAIDESTFPTNSGSIVRREG